MNIAGESDGGEGDLDGGYLFASSVDELLDAACEGEEALLIQEALVPCVEPAPCIPHTVSLNPVAPLLQQADHHKIFADMTLPHDIKLLHVKVLCKIASYVHCIEILYHVNCTATQYKPVHCSAML